MGGGMGCFGEKVIVYSYEEGGEGGGKGVKNIFQLKKYNVILYSSGVRERMRVMCRGRGIFIVNQDGHLLRCEVRPVLLK